VPTDLRTERSRILGVDLTHVPGWQTTTLHTLFTEIGRDLSAVPTAQHCASWLGLCPDTRVSGGRLLSAHTRDVQSRAAQRVPHSTSAFGAFYRRMRARLGAPKAITATAHQLARMLYHLLKTRQAYDESVCAQAEARSRQRRLHRLHREAAALGSTLAPQVSVS
jgi:transposase